MSFLRLLELPEPSVFLYREEASICRALPPPPFPALDCDLLLVEEHRRLGFPLGFGWPLDLALRCPAIGAGAADLLGIERRVASLEAIRRLEAEACVRGLTERVAALEVGFARAAAAGEGLWAEGRDRRYKWEAQAKGGKAGGRKWKCVAETKADGERRVKWEVGVGGEAGEARTYAFEVTSAIAGKVVEEKKGKKKKVKEAEKATRLVEITDPEPEQGAVVPRKAFALSHRKGKGKILSPQDAAVIIQMNFRAYLIRRSQVLRALRSLAVAKAKLKEIRSLFSNFSYRRHIASDGVECQKFSEKIIVLLLTIDAIEGADYMVRASRRSMVEELEAMLNIVDPLPPGKLASLRRRKFDLPDFSIFQGELAADVSDVVQLISQGGPSSA